MFLLAFLWRGMIITDGSINLSMNECFQGVGPFSAKFMGGTHPKSSLSQPSIIAKEFIGPHKKIIIKFII